MRMAVALAVIAAIYLAALTATVTLTVVSIRDAQTRGVIAGLFFTAAIPFALWRHYTQSGNLTLRAVRARPDDADESLGPVVAKLAAQADVATPEVFVAGPALAGASMWHDSDIRGKFFAVIYSPVWLLGLMLMRAVSRYREYAADRGSALLTGAPEQLMSALTKLSAALADGDLRGGAAVEALCVVGRSRFGLLADHPPLEKRLARLAEMSRELGKPLGPH